MTTSIAARKWNTSTLVLNTIEDVKFSFVGNILELILTLYLHFTLVATSIYWLCWKGTKHDQSWSIFASTLFHTHTHSKRAHVTIGKFCSITGCLSKKGPFLKLTKIQRIFWFLFNSQKRERELCVELQYSGCNLSSTFFEWITKKIITLWILVAFPSFGEIGK